MPVGITAENSLANAIATDWAVQAISSTYLWALQPNTASNIYRAGMWPRMDGDRYGTQPMIGLAADIK
jgi:hypothetical protein